MNTVCTHRRWIRRLWIAGALCGLGVASLAGANWWMTHHTKDFIFESSAAIAPGRVAIVPGARVYSSGVPSPALRDRLACAQDLFRDGRVSKILVSGDHGRTEYNEPKAMRRWLTDAGVPDDAIVSDFAGFRTLDTMIRAHTVFGVERAVICTQRFHLARSVYLAREAGIDAIGLVADRVVDPNARYNGTREALARVRALADVHVLGTQPRFPE